MILAYSFMDIKHKCTNFIKIRNNCAEKCNNNFSFPIRLET